MVNVTFGSFGWLFEQKQLWAADNREKILMWNNITNNILKEMLNKFRLFKQIILFLMFQKEFINI